MMPSHCSKHGPKHGYQECKLWTLAKISYPIEVNDYYQVISCSINSYTSWALSWYYWRLLASQMLWLICLVWTHTNNLLIKWITLKWVMLRWTMLMWLIQWSNQSFSQWTVAKMVATAIWPPAQHWLWCWNHKPTLRPANTTNPSIYIPIRR